MEFRADNDTTVDCTATTGTGNFSGGIALEIRAAVKEKSLLFTGLG